MDPLILVLAVMWGAIVALVSIIGNWDRWLMWSVSLIGAVIIALVI